MIKLLFSKKIFIIINLLCIFLCFMIIPYVLYQDVITNHDSNFVFHYTSSNDWFLTGRTISRVIVSCFYVLIPYLFNIHQNDISSLFVPAVTSFFISIMSIFCLKFYYLFNNKNKFIIENPDFFFLYPAIYIILAFIPTGFENANTYYLSGISESVVFYDTLFNFVFFIIFIYFIISSFYKSRNTIIKILYFINSLLLGLSCEPIIFTSFIFYILTISFIILYNKKNPINKNNQQIFLIGIPLILSSSFLFFLSNYSKGKVIGYEINILEQINNINLYYKDYFKGLFNTIISDNIISILIILFLLFCVLLIKDEKRNKYIIITNSMSLVISWILFFIILIIPGYCIVYNYNFWYSHPPFRILFYKTLLIIILLNLSYLSSTQKIYKNIIKILLPIFLYILIFYNHNTLEDSYRIEQKNIKNLRNQIYMSDKMILLYEQFDGIALLPISWYKEYSKHYFIFRPRCYDAEENIRNKMLNIINLEFKEKKSRLFTNIEENDYIIYLYYTYKIKPEGIIWVEDNVAFEEFKKRGEFFSKQELKELNFTKLLREKKNNNISLDEINSQIEKNPKEAYLYAAKARYYKRRNQFRKAIKNISKAIELDKNNYKQYYYLRAEIYVKSNRLEEAEKDYQTFIKNSKYSIEARKKLINLYMQQKEYTKAMKECQNLINIFEFYNENIKKTFYEDLAIIKYASNKYQEVIDIINKEEEISKNQANYQIRALAKLKLGDIKGAYNDIEEVYKYKLEDRNTSYIKTYIESRLNNENIDFYLKKDPFSNILSTYSQTCGSILFCIHSSL